MRRKRFISLLCAAAMTVSVLPNFATATSAQNAFDDNVPAYTLSEMMSHTVTVQPDKADTRELLVTTEDMKPLEGVLIHAVYNDSGTLKSVDTQDFEIKSDDGAAVTLRDGYAKGDKLFVWNSLEEMIPYNVIIAEDAEPTPEVTEEPAPEVTEEPPLEPTQAPAGTFYVNATLEGNDYGKVGSITFTINDNGEIEDFTVVSGSYINTSQRQDIMIISATNHAGETSDWLDYRNNMNYLKAIAFGVPGASIEDMSQPAYLYRYTDSGTHENLEGETNKPFTAFNCGAEPGNEEEAPGTLQKGDLFDIKIVAFDEGDADNIEIYNATIHLEMSNIVGVNAQLAEPTPDVTEEPISEPTSEPTVEPTGEPTSEPTNEPTIEPSVEPTAAVTEAPTPETTPRPTRKPRPTATPDVRAELGDIELSKTGSVQVGDEISVTTEIAADEENVKYEWQSKNSSDDDDAYTPIEGANGAAYTVTADDIGKDIRVVVTVSEDDASAKPGTKISPAITVDTKKSEVSDIGIVPQAVDVFDKKASDLVSAETVLEKDESNDTKYTAKGLSRYVTGYEAFGAADGSGNYLPIRVTVDTEAYPEVEVKYASNVAIDAGTWYPVSGNPVTASDFDENNLDIVMYLRPLSGTLATSVSVVVDLDGAEGTEYGPTTYTIDVTQTEDFIRQRPSQAVFTQVADDKAVLGEITSADLFDGAASDAVKMEGNTVKINGVSKYKTNLTSFSSIEAEQSGNYITYAFAYPDGEQPAAANSSDIVYTVTYESSPSKTWTYEQALAAQTADGVESGLLMVQILRGTNKITIDWDGTGSKYLPTEYTIDISGVTKEYGITMPALPKSGLVTSSVADNSAANGTVVNLTVNTADEEYTLESLKVYAASAPSVNLATGSEGAYSFTMPSENVTVEAVFKKKFTVTLGSGAASVGDTLTAQLTPSDATVTYAWYQKTTGAEDSTYVLIAGQTAGTFAVNSDSYAGKTIKVTATGTGDYVGEMSAAKDVAAALYNVTVPITAGAIKSVTLTPQGQTQPVYTGSAANGTADTITVTGVPAGTYTITAVPAADYKDVVVPSNPVTISLGSTAVSDTITATAKTKNAITLADDMFNKDKVTLSVSVYDEDTQAYVAKDASQISEGDKVKAEIAVKSDYSSYMQVAAGSVDAKYMVDTTPTAPADFAASGSACEFVMPAAAVTVTASVHNTANGYPEVIKISTANSEASVLQGDTLALNVLAYADKSESPLTTIAKQNAVDWTIKTVGTSDTLTDAPSGVTVTKDTSDANGTTYTLTIPSNVAAGTVLRLTAASHNDSSVASNSVDITVSESFETIELTINRPGGISAEDGMTVTAEAGTNFTPSSLSLFSVLPTKQETAVTADGKASLALDRTKNYELTVENNGKVVYSGSFNIQSSRTITLNAASVTLADGSNGNTVTLTPTNTDLTAANLIAGDTVTVTPNITTTGAYRYDGSEVTGGLTESLTGENKSKTITLPAQAITVTPIFTPIFNLTVQSDANVEKIELKQGENTVETKNIPSEAPYNVTFEGVDAQKAYTLVPTIKTGVDAELASDAQMAVTAEEATAGANVTKTIRTIASKYKLYYTDNTITVSSSVDGDISTEADVTAKNNTITVAASKTGYTAEVKVYEHNTQTEAATASTSDNQTFTFTMPYKDVDVAVTFTPIAHTVTVESAQNGSAEVYKVTADGEGYVIDGSAITSGQLGTDDLFIVKTTPESAEYTGRFTVTAATKAAENKDVKTNASDTSPVKYDIYKMPNDNVTVTPSFEQKKYTITVDASAAAFTDKVTIDSIKLAETSAPTTEIAGEVSGTTVTFTVPAGTYKVVFNNAIDTENYENPTAKVDTADTATVNAANPDAVEFVASATQLFAVTFDTDGGGTNKTIKVASGSAVPVDEVPPVSKEGYNAAWYKWESGNVSGDAITGWTTQTITTATTYKAVYTAIDYNITTDFTEAAKDNHSGSYLTISPATANVGGSVTVTAVAGTGQKLTGIAADKGSLEAYADGKTEYTLTMPASDVKITPTFAAIDYTASIGTITNGTVKFADENGTTIDDTSKTFNYNDTVYISAAQNATYVLTALTAGDKSLTSGITKVEGKENLYSFTMPADAVTVSATFEKQTFTITGTKDEGVASVTLTEGTNTISNTATEEGALKFENVAAGVEYTINVTYEDTYGADTIKYGGEDVTKITPASAEKTLAVTSAHYYTLTKQNDEITFDPATTPVKASSKVKITVTPDNGKVVDTVTVNNTIYTANGENKFALDGDKAVINDYEVTENTTVSATFKTKSKIAINVVNPDSAVGAAAGVTVGGSAAASGADIIEGQAIAVSPAAVEGYRTEYTVTGAEGSQADGYTVGTQDVTVTVKYIKTYTITIPDSPTVEVLVGNTQLTFDNDHKAVVDKDTEITIAVTTEGAAVKKITVTGASDPTVYEAFDVTDNTYTTKTAYKVESDITISAETTALHTVRITQPASGGTITVKNGNAEVNDGDKVEDGTELTIAVTADTDYAATKVTVDSAEQAFTVSKPSDKQVYTVNEAYTVSKAITISAQMAAAKTIRVTTQPNDKASDVKIKVGGTDMTGYQLPVGTVFTVDALADSNGASVKTAVTKATNSEEITDNSGYTVPDDNVNVAVKYYYTVTLNAGDGTFGESDKTKTIEVVKGEKLTENDVTTPTAPAHSAFSKWYKTDDNDKTAVTLTDETISTANNSFTAAYTEDAKHNVTLNVSAQGGEISTLEGKVTATINGGSAEAQNAAENTLSDVYDNTNIVIAVTKVDGYTAPTVAVGSGEPLTTGVVSGDTTTYTISAAAEVTAINVVYKKIHTVTFELNNGKTGDDAKATVNVTDGEKLVSDNVPTAAKDESVKDYAKYTFYGWNDGSDTITAWAEPTITADKTYTAVYKITVTFDAGDGAFDTDVKTKEIQVIEGDKIGAAAPAAPSKTGATFRKWTKGSADVDSIADETITAPVTYLATYTAITHKIEDKSGDHGAVKAYAVTKPDADYIKGGELTTEVPYGTEFIVVPAPSEDYTVTGSVSVTGADDPAEAAEILDTNGKDKFGDYKIYTMGDNDVELSASFELIKHTITDATTDANGTITITADSASTSAENKTIQAVTGTEVTITVTPKAGGYKLTQLVVKDKDGNILKDTASAQDAWTAESDGTYKYTVDKKDVTVTATFGTKSFKISGTVGNGVATVGYSIGNEDSITDLPITWKDASDHTKGGTFESGDLAAGEYHFVITYDYGFEAGGITKTTSAGYFTEAGVLTLDNDTPETITDFVVTAKARETKTVTLTVANVGGIDNDLAEKVSVTVDNQQEVKYSVGENQTISNIYADSKLKVKVEGVSGYQYTVVSSTDTQAPSASTGVSTYDIDYAENLAIAVTFTKLHTITLTKPENGAFAVVEVTKSGEDYTVGSGISAINSGDTEKTAEKPVNTYFIVKASPAEDYQLTGITVSDLTKVDTKELEVENEKASYDIYQLTADTTVSAAFEPKDYTITLSVDTEQGTLTVTPENESNPISSGATAKEGDKFTVTAQEGSNYLNPVIKVMKGNDDITATALSNGTLTMPKGDITISASFTRAYTVSGSVDDNITAVALTPESSDAIDATINSDDKTFTAKVPEGTYTVSATVSNSENYEPSVDTKNENDKTKVAVTDADVSGIVIKSLKKSAVTLEIYEDTTKTTDAKFSGVTVTVDNENVGTNKITEGKTLTITAPAVTGYSAPVVKAGDTTLTAETDGTYTTTMPANDLTIAVTYAKQHKLTVTQATGGTAAVYGVTKDGDTYALGTVISDTTSLDAGVLFVVVPTALNDEYTYTGVTPEKATAVTDAKVNVASVGDIKQTGDYQVYTMPAEDAEVTAKYTQKTYTVTVTYDEGITDASKIKLTGGTEEYTGNTDVSGKVTFTVPAGTYTATADGAYVADNYDVTIGDGVTVAYNDNENKTIAITTTKKFAFTASATNGTVKVYEVKDNNGYAVTGEITSGTKIPTGTKFIVIPTANEGYETLSVTVKGAAKGAAAEVAAYELTDTVLVAAGSYDIYTADGTTGSVTDVVTVEASFTQITYTITVTAAKNANIEALSADNVKLQIKGENDEYIDVSAAPAVSSDDNNYILTYTVTTAGTYKIVPQNGIISSENQAAGYKAVVDNVSAAVTIDSRAASFVITAQQDAVVKFNNGESDIKTETVEVNGKLTAEQIPADPTKGGYKFIGWQSSADNNVYSTTEALTALTISANVTFTAQYHKLSTLTVKLGSGANTLTLTAGEVTINGTSEGAQQTNVEETTVFTITSAHDTGDYESEPVFVVVDKEGSAVSGTIAKSENDTYTFTMPAEDAAITVRYKKLNTVTITADQYIDKIQAYVGENAYGDPVTVTHSEDSHTATMKLIAGTYTLKGTLKSDYTDYMAVDDVPLTVTDTDNQTATVKAKQTKFTLTSTNTGAEAPTFKRGEETITATYIEPNTEITVEPAEKSGYTVSAVAYATTGDTTTIEKTNDAYKFNMPSGNVVVTVTYTASNNDLTVTVDGTGAANSSVEVWTVTGESGSYELGSKIAVSEGKASVPTDTKFILVPKASDYADFSSFDTADTYLQPTSDTITVPNDAGVAADTYSIYTMPAASKEVKATFTAKTYTITYEMNNVGIAPTSPTTYTYGTGVATLPEVTAEHYVFGGWYDAATDGNKVESIATTDSGNKTLYAYWTKAQYTITFTSDEHGHFADNKTTAEITVEYGGSFEAKDIPVLTVDDGYRFDRWGSDAITYNNIDQNYTYYAQYVETVKVTFKNGDETLKAVTIDKDSSVAAGDIPSVSDTDTTKFAGWSDGEATVDLAEATFSENTTLNATFVNKYQSFADGKIKAVTVQKDKGNTYADLQIAGTLSKDALKANQYTGNNNVTIISIDTSSYDLSKQRVVLSFGAQTAEANSNIYIQRLGTAPADISSATGSANTPISEKTNNAFYVGNGNTTKSTQTYDMTELLKADVTEENKVLYYTIFTATGREQTLTDFALTATNIYHVNVTKVGAGTVTLDPAVGYNEAGKTITLTPTAEDGYNFTGFTVTSNNAEVVGSDGTYTITMPASDVAVTAKFEEKTGASATLKVIYTIGDTAEDKVDEQTVEGTFVEGDNLATALGSVDQYKKARAVATDTEGIKKYYSYVSGLDSIDSEAALIAGGNEILVKVHYEGDYYYYEDFKDGSTEQWTKTGKAEISVSDGKLSISSNEGGSGTGPSMGVAAADYILEFDAKLNGTIVSKASGGDQNAYLTIKDGNGVNAVDLLTGIAAGQTGTATDFTIRNAVDETKPIVTLTRAKTYHFKVQRQDSAATLTITPIDTGASDPNVSNLPITIANDGLGAIAYTYGKSYAGATLSGIKVYAPDKYAVSFNVTKAEGVDESVVAPITVKNTDMGITYTLPVEDSYELDLIPGNYSYAIARSEGNYKGTSGTFEVTNTAKIIDVTLEKDAQPATLSLTIGSDTYELLALSDNYYEDTTISGGDLSTILSDKGYLPTNGVITTAKNDQGTFKRYTDVNTGDYLTDGVTLTAGANTITFTANNGDKNYYEYEDFTDTSTVCGFVTEGSTNATNDGSGYLTVLPTTVTTSKLPNYTNTKTFDNGVQEDKHIRMSFDYKPAWDGKRTNNMYLFDSNGKTIFSLAINSTSATAGGIYYKVNGAASTSDKYTVVYNNSSWYHIIIDVDFNNRLISGSIQKDSEDAVTFNDMFISDASNVASWQFKVGYNVAKAYLDNVIVESLSEREGTLVKAMAGDNWIGSWFVDSDADPQSVTGLPEVIELDGTYYTLDSSVTNHTYTIDTEGGKVQTVNYTADSSIVYFIEAENAGNATEKTADAICSNGSRAKVAGSKTHTVGSFEAGTYEMTAMLTDPSYYWRGTVLRNASSSSEYAIVCNIKEANGLNTKQFTLSDTTTLYLSGITSSNKINLSSSYDYIIIRKVE